MFQHFIKLCLLNYWDYKFLKAAPLYICFPLHFCSGKAGIV